MDSFIGMRRWHPSVFRISQLMLTLCFVSIGPFKTACAQKPAAETRQVRQQQWERDIITQRNRRKTRRRLGMTQVVLGGGFVFAGGILMSQAYTNHKKVKDYHNQWMEATDARELEQLTQSIEDTENKRDRQHALGIGAVSVGAALLIAGAIVLSIASKYPRLPDYPTYSKAPSRSGPVLGLSGTCLSLTF